MRFMIQSCMYNDFKAEEKHVERPFIPSYGQFHKHKIFDFKLTFCHCFAENNRLPEA